MLDEERGLFLTTEVTEVTEEQGIDNQIPPLHVPLLLSLCTLWLKSSPNLVARRGNFFTTEAAITRGWRLEVGCWTRRGDFS